MVTYQSDVNAEYYKKINQELEENTEKTPVINPHAGVKDRQFRGGISEVVNIAVPSLGPQLFVSRKKVTEALKPKAELLLTVFKYNAESPTAVFLCPVTFDHKA